MFDTFGLVESRTIAIGVLLADCMMKSAQVELIRASTMCSGRYFIQVAGDRSSVETAVKAAKLEAENSDVSLVGSFVISRVHPELIHGLRSVRDIPHGDAIGVIECRGSSSGLVAADMVLKKSEVHLARMVLGQGISGKSYFVIHGDISNIKEAVGSLKGKKCYDIISTVTLPTPDRSVSDSLTLKKRFI
jgi:microcompartment protein CcmL/EutN